jgi:hypothetical protein
MLSGDYDSYYDELEEEAREPACRHCGSTEVRWRQQTGRWVLFSMQPGVEHVCEIDDSDFEAIPEGDDDTGIPPEERLW